jgi:CRP-like cAMP-binding protein
MASENELITALRTIPWFEQFSPHQLQGLVEIASFAEFSRGEDLFHEGDIGDFLYILLEGRIAIDIYAPGRGRITIYTAEPLEVVGWSSVTPVIRQRTASARAVLDSRLLAFASRGVHQICEADHDLGYMIMRRMANVVAGRLMVTRLQMVDLFAPPNEEHALA